MMPTKSFKLLRDSQKCLRTKKNMDALIKKVHQENEFRGE
jgi:hypothetical protein